MARFKPFVPTKEQRDVVRAMTLCAVSLELVARCTINPQTGKPVSVKYLRELFKEELELSRAQAKANVVASLYRQAMRGNVTAGIWLTKNWLGYGDKPSGVDWEQSSDERQRGAKDRRSLKDLSTAELARLYREEN